MDKAKTAVVTVGANCVSDFTICHNDSLLPRRWEMKMTRTLFWCREQAACTALHQHCGIFLNSTWLFCYSYPVYITVTGLFPAATSANTTHKVEPLLPLMDGCNLWGQRGCVVWCTFTKSNVLHWWHIYSTLHIHNIFTHKTFEIHFCLHWLIT